MNLKYGLDDHPPLLELLLYALQWLAVAIPTLIIIGKVVAGLHFSDAAGQVMYLQKLFFVAGAVMIIQLLWGHRLPLVVGPATVLLIGIVASQSSSLDVVYSSIIVGGLLLALLAVSGLFNYLKVLFTPRVVAVILMLIAFTLSPTIMNMVLSASGVIAPFKNLVFALMLTLAMFAANRYLTGVWKATLIIWAMLAGSLIYFILFPQYKIGGLSELTYIKPFFSHLTGSLALDAGVLISFLLGFLALSINDLGSIQSVAGLLKLSDTGQRTTRGVVVTGLGNALAGFLGVIGPVNFSLSPGIIASTGCASRVTLIPAGIGLLALSFSPIIIGAISNVPSVVIGSILFYIMTSQIAAGLMLALEGHNLTRFEDGIIVGLPLLIGTVIAFIPSTILQTFPQVLQPIIGNGFVVGVLTVIILEHLVFRQKKIF